MKKRLISAIAVIMTLALLAAAVPVGIVEAKPVNTKEPTVFALDTVEADPDTDVSISLTIEGEYAATALTIFVEYDPELLEKKGNPVKGEVWYAILDVDGMVQTNNNTPGRFGFMGIVPDGDVSEEGTLFTLKFHVSADAQPGSTIPITLIVDQFTYDELSGNVINLEYEAVDGAVNVLGDPEFTTHTVTFVDPITGEVIAEVEVEHGEAAEAPEAPAHEWYTFTGWDADFSAVTEDITVTAQYTELGDTNGDGTVDMSDALQLMRWLIGSDELACDEAEADFNSDGKTDLMDALLLMRHILGTI